MVLVTSQSLGLFGACGSCSQRPKAAFAESDIDSCLCEEEATAVRCCGSNLFLYRSSMNKTSNAVRKQVWVKSQNTRHFQMWLLEGALNGHIFQLWRLARATLFSCGSYKSHPKMPGVTPAWRICTHIPRMRMCVYRIYSKKRGVCMVCQPANTYANISRTHIHQKHVDTRCWMVRTCQVLRYT